MFFVLVCLDVGYEGTGALAAAVAVDAPDAPHPSASASVRLARVAPYRAGRFFERELPCLMAVLRRLGGRRPDCVLVDGYAWLATGRPGLGAHLFEALARTIPVVGVAKSRFAGNDAAIEILRGQSRRPLFVTACGMDRARAAALVRGMRGASRIPMALKWVDALSRGRSLTATRAPGSSRTK